MNFCVQFLLLGTESGLYAMQFSSDVHQRQVVRIPTINCCVHIIEGQRDINMLLFVVGMYSLYVKMQQ